jgi:hypothetical protein
MCGKGKFQKIWKLQETDACPHCGQLEDALHVWTCQAPAISTLWEQSLQQLQSHLLQLDTDPKIITGVIYYLKSWTSDHLLQPIHDTSIKKLLHLQDTIGKRQFFEGWLHSGWEKLQEQYYTNINSWQNGKCWMIAVITKLWEIAWDIADFCNAIFHQQDNESSDKNIAALNL